MNRLFFKLLPFLFGVAILEVGCNHSVSKQTTEKGSYRAYSLTEAAYRLLHDQSGKELLEVGGITRPVGLVYDASNKDLLLVGEADPQGEGVSADDLAVVMRAVLKYAKRPMVSIEPAPVANATNKQPVIFQGGIENTHCGQKLLQADLVLKKAGLGLLDFNRPQMSSYAELAAESWKTNAAWRSSTRRLWFQESDNSRIDSDNGVAVVAHFAIAVKPEESIAASGQTIHDPAAQMFAEQMDGVISALSKAEPQVARLDPLFRLTGLFQALAEWENLGTVTGENFAFWMNQFVIRPDRTPSEVDRLNSQEFKSPYKTKSFQVFGGIDLKVTLAHWKNAKARSAFKQLVLLSRPEGHPLSWDVPLDELPSGGPEERIVQANIAKSNPPGTAFQTQEFENTRLSQSEMQQQNLEQQSTMREQQADILWRQRDVVEQMREQSENVAMNQASGTERFTDNLVSMQLAAVGAEHFRLGGLALSFVNLGIPGALGGFVVGEARDNFVNSMYNINYPIGNSQSTFDARADFSLLAATFVTHLAGAAMSSQVVQKELEIANPFKWDAVNTPFAHILLGNYRTWETPQAAEHLGAAVENLSSYTAGWFKDAIKPSKVGGISLLGAGNSLHGLGNLNGIQVDANGNLTLIGQEGADIKLPPLRLADLVTVFRSVYLKGEGPTVTIDPNPDNPETADMNIVHSEATTNTYVGWVLYEADRLMKEYSIGRDNLTKSNLVTRVPGYQEVADTIYFGGEDPGANQKQGIWERFWIVPAEANRFEGTRHELTLFDVPLKVKTQKMKWERNQLVDDLNGQSSPGAQAFTAWFTSNYDAISNERYLVPPPATGITNPVPVFAELRRVALMTAIAEKLRDQGVPLPFWMRNYAVCSVHFENTTPGMEVIRTNETGVALTVARIFGGVELSPETKAVNTFRSMAEAADASPEKRVQIDHTIKLADRLESKVSRTLPPFDPAPLTVQQVQDESHTYTVVSLPGATSLALNPCFLEEVDLSVPVAGGREIQLARRFNSFFNPQGPWGEGWTMDLPRLEIISIPGNRQDGKASVRKGFELITPLNRLYARFNRIRKVPELNNSELQVPEQDSPYYGLADDYPKFLKNCPTKVLICKDGTRCFFSMKGDLVAIKFGPQITVYERGEQGQLTRIAAVLGGNLEAQIKLVYSSDGTLAKAVGTTLGNTPGQPQEVSYGYDSSGHLSVIQSHEGTLSYSYQGPWVESAIWAGKGSGSQPELLSQFEYNQQGQLLSEKHGNSGYRHLLKSTSDGEVEASIVNASDGNCQTSTRYDQQMRPVESITADGTTTEWIYSAEGGLRKTITPHDSRKVVIAEAPGARERTVNTEGQPEITADYDAGGHLTSLLEDNRLLLEQKWQSDGQIAEITSGPQAASYDYADDGILSSITEHPSAEESEFQHWQETTVDRRGLPTHIKDFSGLDVGISFDEAGRLMAAVQKTPEGNQGYKIQRDNAGHIQAVKSSWGDTAYTYTDNGDLQEVERKSGDLTAAVKLSGGLVRSVTGFDNGLTTFDYDMESDYTNRLHSVTCANGLKLTHYYDAGQRLTAVAIGTERRVKLDYDAKGRVTGYSIEPFTSP